MSFTLVPFITAQEVLPPGEKESKTIYEVVQNAGTSEDYDESDYIVIKEIAVNSVKENGVTEVNSYRLLKILNNAGCKNQSVLTWRYDPQSSYVKVKKVNVIRNDKSIPVDIESLIDTPAPQSAIYWQDRLKMLQLPRLFVNDGIEIEIYKKGFTYALLTDEEPPADDKFIPPMPGEYFDIVLFDSRVPILEKRYTLKIPNSKRLHSEVFNGTLYSNTTYTPDSTIYSWWNFDIPARKSERYQPGASDFSTKVVMSTAESWEAKSKWFFEINEGQFKPSESIRTKVQEILSSANVHKGSEEEKAEVLLHWVAQNIRYSGQSMGKGEGFTLHSGEMVFEHRNGVCKDIASMLLVMMRAADMKSFAAMTMAGSRIEDLPADQFNHSVVALEKDDGSFEMYDPTWAPYNKDIWSKLESEQHYVVGTPDGQVLDQIRYSPPEESRLDVISKMELDESGNLKGTIKLSGNGAIDSRLRRLLMSHGKSHIVDGISSVLSVIGDGLENVKVRAHDALDFRETMSMTVSFEIPEYAIPLKGGLEFQSPMMKLTMNNRYLLRPGGHVWDDNRENDLFLYYTQKLFGKEEIKLPKKYQMSDAHENKVVDETYAAFSGHVEQEGRKLTIIQDVEIRRRQIPPSGYNGFRDAINGAAKFSETVFEVKREGK